MLQNTKVALQHLFITYTVTILGNKGDVCHGQCPNVNLMFLSTFFFQLVFNICFFKSLLFADQMTQDLFKLK